MPSLGGAGRGALSGATTGATIGSFIPGFGTVIGGLGGAAIGGLMGLFGGGKDEPEVLPEDATKDALMGHAGRMGQQSGQLGTQGQEALGPALQYLKSILGNDPSAIMSAMRPESGRVMDQYDTARKSIAAFAPRGGGQQAAFADTYSDEAEGLNDIFSKARREGFSQAAAIGSNLTGLGLSAAQLEAADLNSVLSAVLTREGFDVTKRGQNMEALGGLGEALGMIIATKMGGGAGGGK